LDSGGLLLSEYPISTPAYKQNFIARNRIISGMSSGTLIVECGLKSGSLITAKYALEQNRPLYAVPGPVYSPESAGPNNLLKMGAIAVTEAQDILNDLNLSEVKIPELPLPENPIESKLLSYLSKKPFQMDELITLSEFSSSQINTTLTLLELRGYIKNIGGSQYVKIR
jgi:DNA processing protein